MGLIFPSLLGRVPAGSNFKNGPMNMALKINYTDKILAGVNHSLTLTSDEGSPSGEVLVDGTSIPHRVVPLREPLWKVSFRIPGDAAGKSLVLKFAAGSSAVDESKEIVAE